MKPACSIEHRSSDAPGHSDLASFAEELASALHDEPATPCREASGGASLNIDPDDVRRSLGQLVVAVLRLVHELLERQATRRVEGGTLTSDEIERVGRTLRLQSEEIRRIQREFGLTDSDSALDLGPLGRLV